MGAPAKERLHKAALAERIGVSRPTLNKYLGMAGAPEPDGKGCYPVEDVADWVSENARSAGAQPTSLSEWKIEEVKLRCEKMRDQLQRDRGEYVSKAEASRTIIPLMTEIGELIRQKFVLELPHRCVGKAQVDIEEICEKMRDEVIRRFREGAKDLIVEAS